MDKNLIAQLSIINETVSLMNEAAAIYENVGKCGEYMKCGENAVVPR